MNCNVHFLVSGSCRRSESCIVYETSTTNGTHSIRIRKSVTIQFAGALSGPNEIKRIMKRLFQRQDSDNVIFPI